MTHELSLASGIEIATRSGCMPTQLPAPWVDMQYPQCHHRRGGKNLIYNLTELETGQVEQNTMRGYERENQTEQTKLGLKMNQQVNATKYLKNKVK